MPYLYMFFNIMTKVSFGTHPLLYKTIQFTKKKKSVSQMSFIVIMFPITIEQWNQLTVNQLDRISIFF